MNSEKESVGVGCLTALAIGVLTVTLVYIGLSVVNGSPPDLSADWWLLPIYVLMAAAPFALLAGTGVTAKLPWLVSIILTAFTWGYLFVDAALNQGAGANIGLGVLMLFSPLVIAGVCLFMAKATGTLPKE